MCGIFGIISRERDVSHEVLTRALKSLAHRGPDDSGTVIVDCGGEDRTRLGLAHTRLSIIDLSPQGHQPMQDPVTGNWIVFNGEIYNFCELRDELKAAGVDFKSHSDTEVILAAYRVWGESCVTRLSGMFAFGLWDAARRRLLLARDPMGIKPLYYYESGHTFIFASEVRTLLQTGLVPKRPDATGVWSYLTFGSVYEPWTIVEGVRSIPPGHVATIENGTVSAREYWNPLPTARRSEKTTTEQLPAILRDAVLAHLVSDVPVGVFLSGGIDSSALVAILSHHGVRPNTFSLVFVEEEFDERRYSREVARYFATEHHEITVSQQDALSVLPDALSAMDQPTIDGVNTYLVSEKTRAAGVKVALSGLGADEMFGGYSNFYRVPKMERLGRRIGQLPRFARVSFAASLSLFAGKSDRNRKLARMVRGNDSTHPYFLARMLFDSDERQALLPTSGSEAAKQSLEQVLERSVAESQSLDSINRVSYLETNFYMRNTLLRDSDFMSMALGLEIRVPFLDKTLVETCFQIPGAQKLEGRSAKGLLLASLGVELPPEIMNRPKRGFTLPFERWMRGAMRPTVEDTLLNGDWGRVSIDGNAVREVWDRFLSRQTSWSRPWSLFVLKRWCEQNL